jgi:uncharacterized membrane protein
MKKPTIRLYILFTILVAFWCAGIIAAPLLTHANLIKSADLVYSFFSHICHQEDARSFHVEGEKLGVCIRCTAIYFGFLAGLLLMPLCGALKRMRVPNKTILIAIVLPMVIDVVLNDFGLHPSTAITRVITGAIFGIAMPWWILPLYIEACIQLIRNKKNQSLTYGVYPYVRETQ